MEIGCTRAERGKGDGEIWDTLATSRTPGSWPAVTKRVRTASVLATAPLRDFAPSRDLGVDERVRTLTPWWCRRGPEGRVLASLGVALRGVQARCRKAVTAVSESCQIVRVLAFPGEIGLPGGYGRSQPVRRDLSIHAFQ